MKGNICFRDFVYSMQKLYITFDPSMSVLKEAPRKYFYLVKRSGASLGLPAKPSLTGYTFYVYSVCSFFTYIRTPYLQNITFSSNSLNILYFYSSLVLNKLSRQQAKGRTLYFQFYNKLFVVTLCSLVRKPFQLKQLHQNRFDVRRY